jgi:hypothetical protein
MSKTIDQLLLEAKNCNNVAVDETTLPNSMADRKRADGFIDLMVDTSKLLKAARLVRTVDCKGETPKLDLGRIVSQGAQTTSCPSTHAPSERTVSYDLEKYRSAFDLPSDFINCNHAGEQIESILVNQFRTQIANDMEFAAIESDSTLPTGNAQTDENNLLGVNDGWLKIMCACVPACQQIDAAGAGPSGQLYYEMLKRIPTRYHVARPQYRWVVATNVMHAWMFELSQRQTDLGDRLLEDGSVRGPWGIPMFEVPQWPDNLPIGSTANDGTVIALTPLQNLIYYVMREFKREKERIPRCDKWEFTMHWYADFQIENTDMIVLAKNVSLCGEPYASCVSCGTTTERVPCGDAIDGSDFRSPAAGGTAGY